MKESADDKKKSDKEQERKNEQHFKELKDLAHSRPLSSEMERRLALGYMAVQHDQDHRGTPTEGCAKCDEEYRQYVFNVGEKNYQTSAGPLLPGGAQLLPGNEASRLLKNPDLADRITVKGLRDKLSPEGAKLYDELDFHLETFREKFQELPSTVKESVRMTYLALSEEFFLKPSAPMVAISISPSPSINAGLKFLKLYQVAFGSRWVRGELFFEYDVEVFLDSTAFKLSRPTIEEDASVNVGESHVDRSPNPVQDPSEAAQNEISSSKSEHSAIWPEPRQKKKTTEDKHRFIHDRYVEFTGGIDRVKHVMHLQACRHVWKALEDEDYCLPGESKDDFKENTIGRIVSNVRKALRSKNYSADKTSTKSKTK